METLLSPAVSGSVSPNPSTYFALHLFDLYSRLKGYSFYPSSNVNTLQKAFHLRWQVYSEKKYINPNDYIDNLFFDKYDAHSIVFVSEYKGDIVGTLRLIYPNSNTQILDQYNIITPRRMQLDSLFEIGRFAVSKKYRGGARLPTIGLLSCAYNYSLKCNRSWWIGNASRGLVRSLRMYCKDYINLPQGPLYSQHIEARQILAGYFTELQQDIQLFAANLHSISFSPRDLRALTLSTKKGN